MRLWYDDQRFHLRASARPASMRAYTILAWRHALPQPRYAGSHSRNCGVK